ncbi:MAG TPA: hypothetical protein PK251_15860, partial [Candidatus Latescibacteria bacterium]|nr:hypothetical protein [Candidatus Latescibacterota bacterium]
MNIKHIAVGVFLSGLAVGALGGATERAAFEAAFVKERAPEPAPPLRIVLMADKKDHGPVGNG